MSSTVKAVDEAGFPHENIVFEVTESEETQDINHLKNIVDYYREQGFKVALDDVGSGYSSLNTAHRLIPDPGEGFDVSVVRESKKPEPPHRARKRSTGFGMRPDFIKLDTQLISGVDSDSYKALVARKVLEMAQGLGVETEAVLRWAQEHGATFVQPTFPHPTNRHMRNYS